MALFNTSDDLKQNKDFCPTSKTGKHWFQPIDTKTTFEPYTGIDKPYDIEIYQRVEYVYLYCACAAIRKERVEP